MVISAESFTPGTALTVQPKLQLVLKSGKGAAGRQAIAFAMQSPYVSTELSETELHDIQGQRFATLAVRGGYTVLHADWSAGLVGFGAWLGDV